MKVVLINVDGHNYPNIPLMKISAFHKREGDSVEWYDPLFGGYYDKVYMSKVFSFSSDYEYPINADVVERGGTGYCIETIDGKEVFLKEKHRNLPCEIEHIYPDYSIYFDDNDLIYDEDTKECLGLSQIERRKRNTAYGFLTRGCPRGCDFCHVKDKEGRCSRKVADLSELWSGQKQIVLSDPNFFACKDWQNLSEQLIESGSYVDFNQGIDVRLMNEKKIEHLNQMKIKEIHLAWDRPDEDLREDFKRFSELYKRKSASQKIVYVLVNFNSSIEQDLYRIYTLRELGYDPYIMIYNKKNADRVYKDMARWVNNRFIWRKTEKFENYRA